MYSYLSCARERNKNTAGNQVMQYWKLWDGLFGLEWNSEVKKTEVAVCKLTLQ